MVIFLDGNSYGRFSKDIEKINSASFTSICIDHHKTEGQTFDLKFGDDFNSATCEIISRNLFEDKDLSIEAINYLIMGIMGDTGGLRFIRKNNVEVLEEVKRLTVLGDLNLESIQMQMSSISESAFGVYKSLIENASLIKLREQDIQLSYSFTSKSTDSKIIKNAIGKFQMDILRMIEGYPWGFIVYYAGNNTFKISFRSSKGAPNVRLICEKYFKGGGHDYAAGGTYSLKENELEFDSEDVCKKIIEILEKEEFIPN